MNTIELPYAVAVNIAPLIDNVTGPQSEDWVAMASFIKRAVNEAMAAALSEIKPNHQPTPRSRSVS